MNELAPVSITVYSRVEHLKQTIEALKKNYFAKQTIVYIFSDAPRKGDEEIVQKVRDYLETINGFKEVIIIRQEKNNYEKNMKDAYTIPLEKHGKFIRMEDDIVASPYFLTFMNNALDIYQNDKSIFAISAYTPQVKFDFLSPNKEDIFLSHYFSAWGYATWEDRNFIKVRERIDFLSEIATKKETIKKIKALHPMMMDMLKLIEHKKTNPGDYKLTAHLLLYNLFTIRPKKSLVKNIGSDGSGHGRVKTNKFNIELMADYLPNLVQKLEYNAFFDKIIYSHYFRKNFFYNLKYKIILKSRIILLDKKYDKIKLLLKKLY